MTTCEAQIAARILRGEAARIRRDRRALVEDYNNRTRPTASEWAVFEATLIALRSIHRRLTTRATRLERGTDND